MKVNVYMFKSDLREGMRFLLEEKVYGEVRPRRTIIGLV